jgi:hypothetical protein
MKKLIFLLAIFVWTISVQSQTTMHINKTKTNLSKFKTTTIISQTANNFSEVNISLFGYTQYEIANGNYYLFPVSGVFGAIKAWGNESRTTLSDGTTATIETINYYVGAGIGSAVNPFNIGTVASTGKTPLTLNVVGGYQIFSLVLGYDVLNNKPFVGLGVKLTKLAVINHKVI